MFKKLATPVLLRLTVKHCCSFFKQYIIDSPNVSVSLSKSDNERAPYIMHPLIKRTGTGLETVFSKEIVENLLIYFI